VTQALPPGASGCSRVRVVVAPISKSATSRVADKVDLLNDVTLRHDFIGEDGERALAETLLLNTTVAALASLTMVWERTEGGRWQRHCGSTPQFRRSTSPTMAWEKISTSSGLRVVEFVGVISSKRSITYR
jgi:hypothetical protein